MSVEEESKAVTNRTLEAINRRDFDAIDESCAPDYAQELKEGIAEIVRGFPDFHGTNVIQIAEGDFVANRLVGYGTHLGEFMGLAPTGERVTFEGVFLDRVVDGKSVESWGNLDMDDLMERLVAQEERKRERVRQELQVARRIQQASLPKEVPELLGWAIAPHYRPAREVGGDFYDFHLLSDNRVGLVVGDATGKGVPAALVMATTSGMLRAVSQALNSSSPSEVLTRVNEVLCSNIAPNMFVTCFYAILDPKSGSLTYANAGHDLPYLHRRSGAAEELRATGMPLGLMPAMGYEEKETILEAGQAALFYSDGLVEAHDPKGEMFGFPRLRALIAEHGEEKSSLGDFLLEELYSFVGEGWEQEDNITLLTLQRSSSLS
jgi:serine phosphatase RsbU (regulator of sigma subunit)/predicted ester cyclase